MLSGSLLIRRLVTPFISTLWKQLMKMWRSYSSTSHFCPCRRLLPSLNTTGWVNVWTPSSFLFSSPSTPPFNYLLSSSLLHPFSFHLTSLSPSTSLLPCPPCLDAPRAADCTEGFGWECYNSGPWQWVVESICDDVWVCVCLRILQNVFSTVFLHDILAPPAIVV